MIRAVLSNPSHPEYGVATIPFPIPHDQYARCMELLEALEIGDAVKADCQVREINSFYSVLKRTEMLDDFYDHEGYAQQRINDEDGMFTDRGYIAYKGYFSLEEIMDGSQSSHTEMVGMV